MPKYALITGASSGIGYSMAIALHKRGYRIIGIAPEQFLWEMKPLEQQIGLIPVACDISDLDQVKTAAAKVKEITGNRLDILYNNAGICPVGGPAIDADDLAVKKIMDVNVVGHMYMTKYCSEMVIEAAGTIIFTSSVAARVPLSWISVYCATKAAIDQYALVLRSEMKPFGVKVHSVITGGVNTGIGDSALSSGLRLPYFDVDAVRDSMSCAADMSRNPRTTITPDQYAEGVANKICKRRDVGFNIYAGWGAYLLHYLRWYCPVWLMTLFIQIHFKQRRALSQVRQLFLQRKKMN
ncbi:hypothetical protein PUMCH_000510 [Australozyma saopauloensis]|uniref:NADPH-dependent 1-acyldihydroxyacetone phosphate reductase n=1 Tax=Australozyma saopauloensis TaxID=291208 RepID=A0AAX4H3X2_9ASCO|nr:hypothetical protein PUMCH_000510 [[Candida] saopauloensis]